MNHAAGPSTAFPTSFAQLAQWAEENAVTIPESRLRFAQFALLTSVAQDRDLARQLVFKGGNALDFIWQPNRSTRDLDFSYDDLGAEIDLDAARLHGLLQRQLPGADRQHGVMFAVHRVVQQPPGENRSFVTFEARVGFALPDELRLRQRMEQGETSANVIPIDVSMNELVCASHIMSLMPGASLRVSTVEDILAEKLRALLQQPLRRRDRRQDLLDICVALEVHPGLDSDSVADYLLRKSASRNVAVSRRALHDPEVLERASRGYAELEATTRHLFIPFERAITILTAFIDTLNIPES